jgi:hypothetical protein
MKTVKNQPEARSGVMLVLSIMLWAAGALLVAATAVLLGFNWNEKIYGPFFTILTVGLATALASIVIGLHETRIDSAFVTSMLLEVEDDEPPPVQVTEENHKLGMRLMDLHDLMPFPFKLTPEGPKKVEVQKPTNDDERQSFCGELLQYYLLKSIQTLQQGRISQLTVTKTSILTSTPGSFQVIQDYRLRSWRSPAHRRSESLFDRRTTGAVVECDFFPPTGENRSEPCS